MNRLLNYSLASLTTLLIASSAIAAEPLPPATPESGGLSSQRLEQIGVALRAEIAQKMLPGAVVAIARKGKLVYYEAFGKLGDTAGSPMPRNAIFPIASMTKVLTAVGVLQLAERGQLSLSAPIGIYLPQLRARVVVTTNGTEPARRQPSLQDLLRHTAGMTYGFEALGLRTNVWDAALARRYNELCASRFGGLSASEFLAKLGALPLQYQPGARWEYGFGADVAGLAIEAMTKQRLGQYLQAEVFEPLGMVDTAFMVPAGKLERLAPTPPDAPIAANPSIPLGHDCGDACAYSTASDYLRFAEMLRRGGSLDHVHVLGRKSVEFITADQLGPQVNADNLWSGWSYLDGYGFGLTVAVRRTTGLGGMPGSPGDFNWGGGGGTYFWVDPKEELSAVLMDLASPAERDPLRQLIEQLVYAALEP
jgi:CubicO group peptidase (beta-lactamase class C family)